MSAMGLKNLRVLIFMTLTLCVAAHQCRHGHHDHNHGSGHSLRHEDHRHDSQNHEHEVHQHESNIHEDHFHSHKHEVGDLRQHSHVHDDRHTSNKAAQKQFKFPEEIYEEKELEEYGFGGLRHVDLEDHDRLSTAGLWVRAMTCSLLDDPRVMTLDKKWKRQSGDFSYRESAPFSTEGSPSYCQLELSNNLDIEPIQTQGKPSRTVVDALAAFGAGSMLGDAFLHQLPHAFGGTGSHPHNHKHEDEQGSHHHGHSLQDLSVGLAVLGNAHVRNQFYQDSQTWKLAGLE